MRLEGKVVLVTGASKGIGRAIAVGMAREGADVFVNYNRDEAGAEEAARDIRAAGRRAWTVRADIRHPEQIRAMFNFLRSQVPALHVLVNNAAITGWTPLFEITVEKWDAVIETNLRGTFFCSLEAARWMKETGGGSIVNVSTNCAELGVKNLVAYASSKGGIHAMTRQLAVELAPYKIRVNTFAPGPTLVERNLSDDPDYDVTWARVVPLGRAARPEEMVGAAIFLACDESSYVTGQLFFVDGGWTVAGRLPEEYLEKAARKHSE
jgi:NAD(P)-dependent dehydrogenase (short-subunit alcohol dehydrogenase family)